METHIGRKLLRNEIVHHLDHNRLNNSVDNLEIMDKRQHDSLETKRRHSEYGLADFGR